MAHGVPFLHDLVTCVAAPTVSLSAADGDQHHDAGTASAQGLWHGDLRVLATCELSVDGSPVTNLNTGLEPGGATFTGVVPQGDESPASVVRVERRRRISPGRLTETIQLVTSSERASEPAVTLRLGSDFTDIAVPRHGATSPLVPWRPEPGDGGATVRHPPLTLHITAAEASFMIDGDFLVLRWAPKLGTRRPVEISWSVGITDAHAIMTTPTSPGPEPDVVTDTLLPPGADRWARTWLRQSLADLRGLRLARLEEPGDAFAAAGAPWYLTLFGRDSLITALFLADVDHELALGTLRTLARLQGREVDPDAAEAPGKIIHELRRADVQHGDMLLKARYYGTIDATSLWVLLFHRVWRTAAVPIERLQELLPTLRAALAWITGSGPIGADADGDGFAEYLDPLGTGLANQGWKDSPDAVRFADGRIATGAIALCEVQGYHHAAAIAAAEVLDGLGEPDPALRPWAAALKDRFADAFWARDGAETYPALALDGDKNRVDAVTSNIGHLLGTGLLEPEQERQIADRLLRPDMFTGLGIRTMSAEAGGYDPLSYHCGSVWPHDTAMIIDGMLRAGLDDHARTLAEGLLRAGVLFDNRLPELWSGDEVPDGSRPTPYPLTCRPQAWSAAAAVVAARALGGRR
ncbi:glycogen debranching N-terminal domain-containing protein [Propionibacteriaceae bacterium Y2011]